MCAHFAIRWVKVKKNIGVLFSLLMEKCITKPYALLMREWGLKRDTFPAGHRLSGSRVIMRV